MACCGTLSPTLLPVVSFFSLRRRSPPPPPSPPSNHPRDFHPLPPPPSPSHMHVNRHKFHFFRRYRVFTEPPISLIVFKKEKNVLFLLANPFPLRGLPPFPTPAADSVPFFRRRFLFLHQPTNRRKRKKSWIKTGRRRHCQKKPKKKKKQAVLLQSKGGELSRCGVK